MSHFGTISVYKKKTNGVRLL